jgi:hypothetical protein
VTKKGAQVAKAVQKAGGNAVATATTEGKQAIVAAGQKATRAFTKSLKGFESLTPELKQLFTQIAELRKAGAGERQLANLTRLFHQQTGYKFTKFVEKFKIAL